MSEEVYGSIPIRQDITIIPADSSKLRLDWVIHEYMGHELTRECFVPPYKEEDSDRYEASIIRGINDLKVGDNVFMWSNVPITITEINGDKGTAEQANAIVTLSHGEDDRQCWVAGCIISKTAIERIEFTDAPKIVPLSGTIDGSGAIEQK